MNNKILAIPGKPLKISFCGFCYFVRGHGDKAAPHTRMRAGQGSAVQNNKNNKNIYINRIARGSVTSGRIV